MKEILPQCYTLLEYYVGILSAQHWEPRRHSAGHHTLIDFQDLIAINKRSRNQNYLKGIILSNLPVLESISYMRLCYFLKF